MTNGSRNELNCAASTRKISTQREAHRGQELAALLPQLARLAGVVDAVARRQDLRGRRPRAPSAPPSSERGATPEILTALSCWKRLSVRGSTPSLQRGDGAERHELAVRAR